MNTIRQGRLLGLQLLAVLLTVTGSLTNSAALLALGVAGFFVALGGLTVMATGALASGVGTWSHDRSTFRTGR